MPKGLLVAIIALSLVMPTSAYAQSSLFGRVDSAALINLALPVVILMLGMYFLMFWRMERHREYSLRERQLDLEAQRLQAEAVVQEKERDHRDMQEYERAKREEEEDIRKSAGSGTGGYIVLDLPEDQHRFFHDLLNGFEEFARLKGYFVSFSIDATFPSRIAFKFTLREGGISVGPERVRKDFEEYVNRVRSGGELDDMPVIISLDEHELLVTVLKNRISFLQHTYRLQQNALDFYQRILDRYGPVAALPAPSVVVQTGGTMDSRRYSAVNSSRLLQGDRSHIEDASSNVDIRIGESFNERADQIGDLDRLIAALSKEPALKEEDRENVARALSKVADELREEQQPSPSRIERWLKHAKTALDVAKLGGEASELVKKVFESFGLA